ncbi:MAG: FG-GAP-like repeat-containing protein [Dermatophilaceae bacterium]
MARRSSRITAGRRIRTVLLGPLVVLALLVGSLTVPTASAAPMFGHDVSWPQCPTAVGGYALPMPPTDTQFVIIGLTHGLPFTENPCLGSQLQWVRDRSKPAHAYGMAAFPTATQLSTYGSSGPWSRTTRAGQLSNVGYAEAMYAVASLARVGWRPAVVWIDVEPRPAQPWPTGTATRYRENRFVIEGFMRGLRDSGYSYGLYSYTNGWNEITGGWRLPGVPVWATAGRLDYPEEALDRCTQASFSGGRVYVSQWYDDTRDYDRTCDPYAFTDLPIPASSLSNSTAEFNGDWNNDVLARWGSTQELRLYPGTGTGRLATSVRIGTNWGRFNALDTLGDFSGDGALDVIARDPSTGYLWLYPGNGTGGWQPERRIGSGWNIFNAILGVGDFSGDQRADVLARESATGYLWLYPGNGTGGWLPRVRVGSGWNSFNALVAPGDFTGDGYVDVLARERSTGYLWLYPGNGARGWLPRVRVGSGWNSMTAIMSPGDLNGDRVVDVIARDGAGALWLYPRTAGGAWAPRVQIGAGWSSITAIL